MVDNIFISDDKTYLLAPTPWFTKEEFCKYALQALEKIFGSEENIFTITNITVEPFINFNEEYKEIPEVTLEKHGFMPLKRCWVTMCWRADIVLDSEEYFD